MSSAARACARSSFQRANWCRSTIWWPGSYLGRLDSPAWCLLCVFRASGVCCAAPKTRLPGGSGGGVPGESPRGRTWAYVGRALIAGRYGLASCSNARCCCPITARSVAASLQQPAGWGEHKQVVTGYSAAVWLCGPIIRLTRTQIFTKTTPSEP